MFLFLKDSVNKYLKMNSTIMIQKSVKDLAAKKAKKDGLSLSVITRFLLQVLLQGYAE